MFIGENLKNLRVLFGYSQAQLATMTDIRERDIWQFENGYKTPEFQEVNKLKAVFYVKSSYFYAKDMIADSKETVDASYISIRR